MINAPVSDKLTLRGVAYRDNQGGYINNVKGTLTAEKSAALDSAVLAANPLLTDDWLEADNSSKVEENFSGKLEDCAIWSLSSLILLI